MAKRHDQTGRSTTQGRFLQLPYFLLVSAAWRSLTPQARAVFLEVAMLHNGHNNGFLALSVRDAASRANISKDTATRCFAALRDRGFLVCTAKGHFDRKVPHAAEWSVTLWGCSRSGDRASKAFMRWRPSVKEKPRSESGARRSSTRDSLAAEPAFLSSALGPVH